jgi:mono/diheme cytochrome c family protein
MVTVWNAPITETDVTSIVTYLSRHFGPSSSSSTTQDRSVLQANPDEELSTFLPNDEGKVLLTVYCRGCHSATQIRQNLAQRAGGNENYWNALVQRMITVWNAPIAEEDVAPIVTYLSKHFGPTWAQ